MSETDPATDTDQPTGPAAEQAPDTDHELAFVAYDAYGDETGWRNFRGEPMPSWNELPDQTRAGWTAAAGAVARHLRGECAESGQ